MTMVVAVIWLLCGLTSAVIADSKGRSTLGWFVLGCIIGVFAIIMVACLPRLEDGEPVR